MTYYGKRDDLVTLEACEIECVIPEWYAFINIEIDGWGSRDRLIRNQPHTIVSPTNLPYN